MEIEGYRAVIQFDPDIDLFRGEFVGLNGGADFYAPDVNIVVPRPAPRACDVTSFLTKLNRPAGENPRCPS